MLLFLAIFVIHIIISWKIPNGHIKEQYTLPNNRVNTIRKINATAAPHVIETRAGVNCIFNKASDKGFPPLILRKPHVAITNTIVEQTILIVLSILPMVFEF